MSDSRTSESGRLRIRSAWCRRAVTVGILATVVIAVAGCSTVAKHPSAHATPSHHSNTSASPTGDPTPTAAPNPAISHAATPGPVSAAFPSPTITAIPRGTVVASGDVASPKGSIHFHYAVVANGDNTYSAEYSGFTSTVPVPISVTLLDVAPHVGDGLTYHGVGDHQLGGPATTATPASSAVLNSAGPPSYLIALVTYSSATSSDGIPVELGPNKVLAVNSVQWSIPARQTNVHPSDGGTRAYASGKVTTTTATGAPKRYLVAPGDITAVVAQRFGISVEDLIWLNANLEVFGDQQYLYEGTTLNLDPNSL
ncbi:MAG TPA: LysM domain-containing protein [Galbitalea sp.]|nr:LysM domain-containing protein [Galbitalea sp.]